jgi:uncharacterized protein (DUF2235 family)
MRPVRRDSTVSWRTLEARLPSRRPLTRHLIACCDGTWQIPRNHTNVHRPAEALASSDGNGVVQECRYFEGVGAVGSVVARVTGGVAGQGLSENVRDAYLSLATTYRAGAG